MFSKLLKTLTLATCAVTLSAVTAFAGVTVSSPAPGATSSSPVHFVASASSVNPVSSMTVYVDGVSKYQLFSNHLDTYIALGGGSHSVVVQAWDARGAVYKASETISVGNTSTATASSSVPSTAKTFNDIDQWAGWENCDSCAAIGAHGPTAPHNITQGVSNPSMDGKSAQFWIGGNTPYSDALWWKQLGGNDGTSHFAYDLYFYVKDTSAPLSLEFDANQGFGGKRYIMGTQCGINWDKQWDVWNASTGHWMATGIPCTNVKAYTWNHLTEEFARVNGQVQFISITLNGQKAYVNRYSNPQPIPANVHELNVAVQLDTNAHATPVTMWVDKITLNAW